MRLLKLLSPEAQEGLRAWARSWADDLLFDDIGNVPEHWAWLWFRLREAPDRPEWFPKGKSATLQVIEQQLSERAREMELGT